ncbi:phosphatase PAP2 family protein [Mycobacterium intracellulare subsp. chimaera]|uniref:phosphatase PAP2 family protein n=1 Tax=Mycobacterium intracellulare TaxID=1767 RepID=UPI002599C646|nr:phosphatase PAP2 family protein [Mycobacterium intracellulare]MDM3904307.1 phosphatase PAP2 family protein [Mycobacterium intracellulare subsp. chimaera]
MVLQYGSGTQGFGPVSIGALVSLVLLVASAVWVARHPHLVPRLWARVHDSVLVGRVKFWARKQIQARGWPLLRRLPASEVASVALLVGLALVLALAVGFTEVLGDVLEGDGIAGIDQPAARWLANHRDLWLTTTLRVITGAGGVAVLAAVAVVACAAAVWRSRSWPPVVFALAGAGGITLVIFTAKALVVRNRPPLPFALIAADGFSFPSGHATGVAVGACLTAWLLTRWLITWWTGRVVVWTAAIGVAAVVGFSRVYLGVHYISDVLAGWLLGAAWVGAVMVVGSWWDNTRRGRAHQTVCRNEMAR